MRTMSRFFDHFLARISLENSAEEEGKVARLSGKQLRQIEQR